MPVFFLEGLSGSFFRPLAFSYILAILSSLFVALTLTPALALFLLPKASESKEARLMTHLKDKYEHFLPKLIDNPKQVFIILAAVFILALISLPFLGQEFLPV